jgi:RHS repeat-associated protein
MSAGRWVDALRCAVLLCALGLSLMAVFAAASKATPPSSAIRYGYDATGQLKSVTDPAGTTALFGWDPVGNLLSVGNQPAGALSLIQVAPLQGSAGDRVALYGTGFSSTPADDAVSFNGMAASVVSASPWELVVTVPAGATTGPVSVTTPSGSATSDASFTVAARPAITAISPTLVNPGDTVTVRGSAFDPAPANDTLIVNRTHVDTASASATALSFVAPAIGSGPVSVATPDGQATGPDLFIAPSGRTAANIATTDRMRVGDTRTVSIPTANKIALVVFDGSTGQQLLIQTSQSTFGSTPRVSVMNPNGSTLVAATTNSFIDQFTLPTSGTYTIMVDASSTGAGSISVALKSATDVTTTVTPSPTGGRGELSTTLAGQNMAFTFDGRQGQRIAFEEGFPASLNHALSLRKPDGSALWGPTFTNSPLGFYWVDVQTLPTDGTYTIYSDISGTAISSSTRVTAYDVPADVSGTLRPSQAGDLTTFSTTPGQNAMYTIDGTAGQRVSVLVRGSTYPRLPNVSIVKPDGSNLVTPSSTSFIDAVTLPSSGTYRVVVDPQYADAGQLTLTAYDAADATATVTPSATGGSGELATTVPGQNVAFTFDGRQGQRIAFEDGFPASLNHSVALLKPDGTALTGPTFTNSPLGFYWVDVKTLPADGTYKIYLDISGTATSSSMRVKVYDVPADVSGTFTPSPAGDSVTFSTTPAQNATYTFSGTAGQRISLTVRGSTYPRLPYLSILKPDGSTLVSPTSQSFVDAVTLPSTATYRVVADPQFADSGQLTLTAYDASDATTSVTPSATGTDARLSTTAPGQNMAFTFSATAGQRIAFKEAYATGVDHYLSLKKPDGSALWGQTFINGGWGSYSVDKTTLPVSGTYTIYVDPTSSLTSSSTTVTVYDVPADVTGTLTPSQAGDSVTPTTTPGQNAVYTISGTAGQRVSLTAASSTYPNLPKLSIVKPDGSNLVSPTSTSFVDAVSLPSSGTYRVVVDPQNLDAGQVRITAYDAADATMAVTPSASGGAGDLSTVAPGQNMAFTFTGTAGQVIALRELFPTTVNHYLSIRKPDGSNLWGPTSILGGWASYWVDKTTLPVSGTYTIYADPNGSVTSTSNSITLHDVPADVSGTMSIGGPTLSFTTTPAQNGSFTFSSPANKTIHLSFSNVTETANWTLKNPSGGTVTSSTINSGNTATITATLVTAGTYTLVVDPQSNASGGMTLTLTDPPGFTQPFITDTTLPEVFREPPSLHGIMARLHWGRPLRCGPQRTHPGNNRARAHTRTTACASSAAAPRTAFHVPSDVRRRAELDGPARDIAIDQPGQKATVQFTAAGRGRLTLQVERASTRAYLFLIGPGGRKAMAPRLLRGGHETVPLRLREGGAYVALIFPTRGDRASFRVRLVTPGHNAGSRRDMTARRRPHSRATHTDARRQTPSRKQRASMRSTHHRSAVHAHPRQRVLPLNVDRSHVPLHVRFQPGAPRTWIPKGVNLHGDWETGRSISPWQQIGQLEAPVGVTALAGQALRLDGTPLAGVTMTIEGSRASARTDRNGRFLLEGAPAGHGVLAIDGGTVKDRGARYGFFKVGVDLHAGETVDLGFPVWMTQLDRVGDTHVESPTPHEVVLTTPRIPGLEVRIPAGSTIRDRDGHLVHDLNITQVPVDRPPFPLPPHVQVPLYFTVQPGGAYLSKGAQIIYPNYTQLPARQRVDFWNYDAEGRGWYVYGRGTVSDDAKQVIPDADVRVWEFTGAMITSSPTPPGVGPVPGGGSSDGDPVDLQTGLFVYRKTDLFLPDSALPIALQRTYRPNDTNSYAFGVGTTLKYDMRLWSVTNYTAADLVLPDGARVHYVRTSPGSSWEGAVYEAQNAPGEFYGSKFVFNGAVPGWDLTLRDGTMYRFGDNAPLQAIIDRYGNTLTLTRSAGQNGNITRITAPNGRWVRLTYDTGNRATQATDNSGRRASYSYDASGRLATVTDPVGNQTSYRYDANGNMTTIHDARGHDYVTNTYSDGRVVQQTMADGATYQFDYDFWVDPVTLATRVIGNTVTQPGGRRDRHQFDLAGYETSVTRDVDGPNPQTTRITRSASELPTDIVDPLGHTTTIRYDGGGRPTSITRLAGTPDAKTTAMTYEPTFGHLTSVTDPLGHTSSFSFDVKGRLTAAQDATGRKTSYAYSNPDGLPTSITDPIGNVTQLAYYAGDLTAVTDPAGNRTTGYYDAAGRLVAATDPVGNRARYEYDGDNELTRIVDPTGHATTLGYDPDGNLLTVQDARGNATAMTYDPLGRVLTSTDGLNRTATFAYDLDGHLVRMTSRRGVTSAFQYDTLGRLRLAGYGAADTQGNAPFESSIAYTFDAGDQLLRAEDTQAGTFGFGYDDFGRVTSATTPDSAQTFGYDAADRLTSAVVNGTLTTYGYESANRLTSVAQGSSTASIGYDGAGRRSSVALPNGVTKTYTYDAASRLTDLEYMQRQTSIGDLHYAYDPDGHRLAQWGSLARVSIPAPMASATYDAANERTSQGRQTLLYDRDGNLLDDGTTTYAWDARGQLASTAGPGLNVSYAYDPFGRRIGKTLNSQQTRYAYLGANLAQEISGGLVASNMLTGLSMDDLFARTAGGSTSSYLTDALGSVLALSDSTGTATTSYTYGPFGETSTSGTTSTNPFQFTGRENDDNGLYNYRARYYSPDTKRFASEDPVGMAGSGTNLYRYVGNDPTDYTDPMGLFSVGDAFGQASQFSAGLFDGALLGLPSMAFGIPQECWGSAHAFGQIGSAAAMSFTVAGGVTAALSAGRGLAGTLAAGAVGGAAGGAYNAAGTHIGASPTQVGMGALTGTAGGTAGAGLGYSFSGPAANAGAAVTSWAFDTSTAIGTGQSLGVSGPKDQC